jgi:RNA polymerase sigma factor (sigma-70 family)
MADSEIVKIVAALLQETDDRRREEFAVALYSAIKTNLFQYIRRRVYESEADDVMGETLKAIFTSLHKFEGSTDEKFQGWYLRIARNKCIDQRRRRKDSDDFDEFSLEDIQKKVEASFLKTPPLPGEELDFKFALELLKKLKVKCRRLLLLHFVNGTEVTEIAKLLELKYDTALRRIQRCLDSAKDVFEGYEF